MLLLTHDYTQQQNNDKDCGVFCCVNAYTFIYNKDILLKKFGNLANQDVNCKEMLKVKVTEILKKSDVVNENKLEHMLEE